MFLLKHFYVIGMKEVDSRPQGCACGGERQYLQNELSNEIKVNKGRTLIDVITKKKIN